MKSWYPIPAALCALLVHTVSYAAITDQLVLHLPFDSTLADTSGLKHDGVAVGKPGFGAGKIGSGAAQLSFNKSGTNFNYITLGSPADLNFGTTTDFSVSFWVKFKDWSFDPPFIGNKDWLSGANQGWMIATGTDGRLQWNYSGLPGQRKDYDGPGGTVNDGNWHHVVMTVLRAGEVVTYLDGASVDERDVSVSLNNVDNPAGLALNLGQDGTGHYTDGNSVQINDLAMDDLGIWRRVITSNEVKAIYSAGQAGHALDTVNSSPEVPTIVRQPTPQSAVAGDNVLFRVLPRGTSPFTFTWTRNGVLIPGATNALLGLTNVQFTAAGNYRCAVSNGAGRVASDDAELLVDATQPPTIRVQPLSVATAIGSRLTLSVDAAGVSPLTFQWFKDGTALPSATAASYVVLRAAKTDSGHYTVKIRGGNGQSVASSEAIVDVVSDIRQGLVAHLTFDNDFSDSSGRGNHGTPIGKPTLVEGLIGGKALRFSHKSDGSEFNYLTLGKAADLEFSTDADFSFSCWVKFSKWQRDPLFIANKNWNSGGNVGYALATGGDGRFQWNYAEQVGERRDFDSKAGLVSDGRWHHVGVAFQRGGEVVTLVDGIEMDRQPLPTTGTTVSPGYPTNIGQDGTGTYTDNGTVSIEDGTIDDVAIWRRAITPDEMRSIYRKGLIGANVEQRPLDEALVAYLPFDGDYWDRSGKGTHGIPVGNPTFAPGVVGSALSVSSLKDGRSFNFVTLGSPTNLNFGKDTDFTLSFWTRFTNWTGDPVFIANKDWRSGGNQGWVVATAGNGRLQWNLGDGDSGGRTRKDYDGPAGTLSDGLWHHVATVFSRQSDARTYLDGKLVDTTPIKADLDSLDTPAGLAANIGQDGHGDYTDSNAVGSREMLIDDLAIWRRALDGAEIAAIQARGTSGKDLFGRIAAETTLPNGVAAGDPTTNSIVLWTRSTAPGVVTIDVGTNADFSISPPTTYSVNATNALVPVKVTVTGLNPGTQYQYRVTDSAGSLGFGTFRTLAAPGVSTGLRFGISGDARGELAPFPSLANAPVSALDFFVNFGDTIYADYPSPAVPAAQAKSIDDFRRKHDEIYSPRLGVNHFGVLRSTTAFFATIDDHEVANDFAGAAPAGSDSRFDKTGTYLSDSQLYKNGLQAFQEFNPVASEVYNAPSDARTDGKPRLYRARQFGRDAALFLLDARTFRDSELAAPANPTDSAQVSAFLARSFDVNPLNGQPLAHRTMLGQTQIGLLKTDLLAAQVAGVAWKFVLVPEPIQNLGVLAASDRFEGYAAERSELLGFVATNHIRNVVFVTADIHGTLVNNLTYQLGPGKPQLPTSSFEVVTGPVAYDAPFGPTVLDLAADVPVGSKSLLDTFLASLGLPNRAAFDTLLTPTQKNDALKGLIDSQVTPLGYSKLGLDDSGLDAAFVTGGPVAAFTYGWTQFEITPGDDELRITTFGIEAYQQTQVNADLLLRTPKVINQLVVRSERPVLSFARSNSNILLSWDSSFVGYQLEFTSVLGAGAVWTPVVSSVSGAQRVATVPLSTASASFMRLRQP